MGLLDKAILGVKNLIERSVDLHNGPNGQFILTITEGGKERSRSLTYAEVLVLEDMLWNTSAVKTGIVMRFSPNPHEYHQQFAVPSWAMERLRVYLIQQQIHLSVN